SSSSSSCSGSRPRPHGRSEAGALHEAFFDPGRDLMNPVPVSVLIPVRNEAHNLPRCVDALKGWADEVVVVDSQSTDGTIEIAEQYGATVLQFHYQGGWPKKRQWALDTYPFRNDWILLLDADEILLDPIKEEMAAAIRSDQ